MTPLFGFIVAVFVTMALIPPLMRWAAVLHIVDIPDQRKVHQGVTIGGGGHGEKFPVIGERVYFGAGAKIVSPVKMATTS